MPSDLYTFQLMLFDLNIWISWMQIKIMSQLRYSWLVTFISILFQWTWKRFLNRNDWWNLNIEGGTEYLYFRHNWPICINQKHFLKMMCLAACFVYAEVKLLEYTYFNDGSKAVFGENCSSAPSWSQTKNYLSNHEICFRGVRDRFLGPASNSCISKAKTYFTLLDAIICCIWLLLLSIAASIKQLK